MPECCSLYFLRAKREIQQKLQSLNFRPEVHQVNSTFKKNLDKKYICFQDSRVATQELVILSALHKDESDTLHYHLDFLEISPAISAVCVIYIMRISNPLCWLLARGKIEVCLWGFTSLTMWCHPCGSFNQGENPKVSVLLWQQ